MSSAQIDALSSRAGLPSTAMGYVDSHCHASLHWYEPIETLLFEMDRNEVDQAVLIQIMGQYDNSYQQECAQRYPERLASVVLVDPSQPDAPATLERLAEAGARGVRLTPGTRSPGEDPLAIWRAAARLRLTVSCGGSSADFSSDAFADLLVALPGLQVVIEHLASVSQPDRDDTRRAERTRAFDLARFPNTFIKVTGLGEFARRAMPVPTGEFPFAQPLPDYLEQVYTRFGPSRMMWGSDFPPVASREGYRSALRLCIDQFADKSESARAAIFGDTARAVFRVPR
jgi:L-fuconolactonase